MSSTDSVNVTTVVAAEPQTTFAIFTEEVDSWWKVGPRFRASGARMQFESGEGGRLLQTSADGSVFEVGRIRVWKPGDRLVLSWRNQNFEPDQITEVEVRFEAAGSGTRVTIVHRGWDALPADHEARHGLEGRAFSSLIGGWWGDLALSLRSHVAKRPSATRRPSATTVIPGVEIMASLSNIAYCNVNIFRGRW